MLVDDDLEWDAENMACEEWECDDDGDCAAEAGNPAIVFVFVIAVGCCCC